MATMLRNDAVVDAYGLHSAAILTRMTERTFREGAFPFALIRATKPADDPALHLEILTKLSEVLMDAGYPPPPKATYAGWGKSQPYVADWEVTCRKPPGKASYLVVATSGPSISPCPVDAPEHSTMFAIHTHGDDLTLFSPCPQYLQDNDDVTPFGKFRQMRCESGISIRQASDLLAETTTYVTLLQRANFWPMVDRRI